MTELVFILDRSGSMAGLEADTIGGFNSMIARQKQEAGEALVSTVLFDNESVVIHDRLPLAKVPLMTKKGVFHPGLHGAAGRRRWSHPPHWEHPQVRPPGGCAGKRPCSSSPPTAMKTPAAAIITRRCGA